jgi:hypothetical protein
MAHSRYDLPAGQDRFRQSKANDAGAFGQVLHAVINHNGVR